MWQYVWLLLRRQARLSAGVGLPSYDLVVLPPQAQPLSKSIVPGDFLESYGGGIRLQQYEQSKHLSGIDVAAPVAFVSYVPMPTPQVIFSQGALAPGYSRLERR